MSYTLYQADLDKDKAEILKFCAENRKKPLDEKFKWIYACNPHGKAMVWLIKHDQSGELAGMTSLFPRRFYMNNKLIKGAVAGDFLVHEKHRTLGPALMLQQGLISAIDNGIDFIYGFPNKRSEPVFKRVGYQFLGPTMRLVKVMNTASHLRKHGLHEWFINLVNPFSNGMLKMFSFETWHRKNRQFSSEEITRIDSQFDDLWEKVKNNFDVIGERTTAYLTWKYLSDPDDDNKVFAIYDVQRISLKGFIIYSHEENSLEIRDFLFSDKSAGEELFSSFFKHVRKSKAESLIINLLANNDINKMLKQFGFLEGRCGRNIYIYTSDKLRDEMNSLLSSENWMLVRSDEDS